jgi:hypothetical protein
MKNFKINIEKNDAATSQLDWAIRLFLDHDEFIPAITLAGAAEGILGGLLGDRSPHKLVKKNLALQSGLSETIVSDEHLNRVKNWLKHSRSVVDEKPIMIDLKGEATQNIVRAILNFYEFNSFYTIECKRFLVELPQSEDKDIF